jgi:hypothetical protein
MRKRITVLLAAAVLMMAAFTSNAQALQMRASIDGVNWTTLFDGGPGDANPISGAITSFAGLDGFAFSILTGANTSATNSANLSILALAQSTAGGTLHIQLTETGLIIFPTATYGNTGLTLLQGPASVTTNTYWGAGAFDTTNLIASGFKNTISGSSWNTTFTNPLSGEFSLTEELIITQGPNVTSNVTGSLIVTPVPEPGTMLLLGFGMLSLAVYGKRRMNKEV